MRTELAILLAAVACTAAMAQPPGPPPRIDFAKELNLSPERWRQMEAILLNEQEQHRAVRERARAEIRKLLTPEEFAKYESLIPKPRGPMGPPPERR